MTNIFLLLFTESTADINIFISGDGLSDRIYDLKETSFILFVTVLHTSCFSSLNGWPALLRIWLADSDISANNHDINQPQDTRETSISQSEAE